MSEVEKQEGQKTVVAFVAGLLIGGLLVWVFSAPAENQNADQGTDENDTTEVSDTSNTTNTNGGDSNTSDDNDASSNSNQTSTNEPVGEGEISVTDQGAGGVVVLDTVTYPTNNGWIVVRDYRDGVPGNILGAARYSKDTGLLPQSVSLLRATEAGNSYQVVFFNENGDRVFDLEDDVLIEGFSAVFMAE